MLMGSNCIVWLIFYVSLSPIFLFGLATGSHDAKTLDAYIQQYAQNALVRPRTGTLYNISLPSNFSGMEVSIIRYRSMSLWSKGSNVSFFDIPTRIVTHPFVTRLDLVFENLGNWSSSYFNVPNYTFATPVIGFMAFSAMNSTMKSSMMLNLSSMADPIKVRFPRVWLSDQDQNQTRRCVKFGHNGSVEFSNVTMRDECIVWDQGHFTIVVPSNSNDGKKRREKLWKWWVVGFGVGVVGLVLVILIGVLISKVVRGKKMGKMERQSEKSEALDTIWVGRSKMPSATGIRTQPVLENEYAP